MIKARLAKTLLEHEEGLNYLWIRLVPGTDDTGQGIEQACLHIALPAGVRRLPNLSGYAERESGGIVIDDLHRPHDIFIELFTAEPASCGSHTIRIAMQYRDIEGREGVLEHVILLTIVSEEEELESVVIDDEVVDRINRLQRGCDDRSGASDPLEYGPGRLIRIDPYACSEPERKYRIEGMMYREGAR